MPISRCFTSSPNSSSLLGCHHYGILYTNLSLARTITILPPLYLLLCSLPPPSPPLQGSGDQIPTCSNILLCSPLYRVQYLTISHSEYPSMSSVFVLAALSGSCVRLLWSQYHLSLHAGLCLSSTPRCALSGPPPCLYRHIFQSAILPSVLRDQRCVCRSSAVLLTLYSV